MKRFVLFFAAVILLGGVAFQFLHVPNVKDGKLGGGEAAGQLALLLPESPGGWVSREEPLGANESVTSATQRILNFDDYAYRVYQRGDRRFGVYVAYWEPGRMPTHKVASHTPDRCWVENGWTCTGARFGVAVAPSGLPFKPAEWRTFTPPGSDDQKYVLYWHLVGDELYDYGERLNTRPHPIKWLRDSIAYAAKGSQAQYFIRVSADKPLDELLADPSLRELWLALGKLGLRLEPVHG
jgi:hypothetical protein